MSHAVSFLTRLAALDAALVAAGFPATSPWWRAQIERFMRAARRRWVVRAGRRAGKSSTLCRLAVAWALWGQWSVPPGDVAVVPFISVSKDEAAARLRTIGAILKALGVPFDERGDELEISGAGGRPVLFKVFACNTSAVVGFTSIAVFGDEVARWESRDTGANPAREVIGSLSPTMATQPTAFMVLSSSPWSVDDFHAEQFDLGDTGFQIASFAPTWVANPTITEEQTHELEPDERVWAREYAAIPGATVSAAFDPSDVAACFGRSPAGKLGSGFLAIDASSLRGDGFAWAAGRESDAGEIVVLEVDAFEGERLREVSIDQVVEHISERAKAWDARRIFADQRDQPALGSMFARRQVASEIYSWSEPSKEEAFQILRRLMRERRLLLPDHAGLRREMGGIKAHLLPSGRTKYATNGLDFASCIVTLAHAVVADDFVPGGSNEWELLRYFNARLGGSGAKLNGRDYKLGLNEPPLPGQRNAGTRMGNMPGRGFG